MLPTMAGDNVKVTGARRSYGGPTTSLYNRSDPLHRTIFISIAVSASLLFGLNDIPPALSTEQGKQSASNTMIYKSGKTPQAVDGPSSSRSSGDSKTGTRKDIDFLRRMSNCKTSCQRPGEGLAKIDCVQDCQDQCCDSYEQCSFKIKINNSNSI